MRILLLEIRQNKLPLLRYTLVTCAVENFAKALDNGDCIG
jgi:hypothetical protein